MKEYLYNRKIPYDDTWDVIVAGGGPAGCAAAVAAARNGAKTLLLEATGCLGGMGTAGLVPAWCPFSDEERIVYRSIALEVFEKAKENMAHVPKNAVNWVPINAENLKLVYDRLVSDSGASVLFGSFISSVDTNDNGEIAAVIVSNKNGLSAYSANIYIDCTGDADLAAWAGAEFEISDVTVLQPATHCFSLGNVDEYAYKYGPRMHGSHAESPIHAILEKKEFPLIVDAHICNNIVAPGEIGFNAGHIWAVDNTNAKSVSDAMIVGRKMAYQYQKALAAYHPKAFSNAYVSKTATLMGIRETRRIVGEYVLTVTDYLNRQSFDDEIGRSCYYADVHSSKQEMESGAKRPEKYGKGDSYGIPYRCLVPLGVKNLLVAGRSISCDRMIHGSARVMPVCLVTGEAAGIAASLAVLSGDVRSVNTDKLREILRSNGAYIK